MLFIKVQNEQIRDSWYKTAGKWHLSRKSTISRQRDDNTHVSCRIQTNNHRCHLILWPGLWHYLVR